MGVTSFLKRLFGSAKEATNELADKAELALKQVKENATPYIEKAESFVEESIEKTKETATPLIEKANDYAHQTKEVIGKYANETGDMLGNIAKTVKESAAEALKETEAVIKETKELHADMTESEGTLTNYNTSKEFRNRVEEDAD